MTTYEVVWSGSLDKLGACKSLTGYLGPSSLLNAPPDRPLSIGDLQELRLALGLTRKGRE